MGALVFISYLVASAALVFVPATARVAIAAVAFVILYVLIHRRGKIAAQGAAGIAARVLVSALYWALLFTPSYLFHLLHGAHP